MRVLNAAQMREADRRTIEDVGLASIVLMENAGRQVVAAMEATFPDLTEMTVGVLAGRGNNGGDGFVVARVLAERGVETRVFLVGSSADVRGDARTNLAILAHLDIMVVEVGTEEGWELHGSDLLACDIVVDALFGTGLREPLSGLFETIIADVNESARHVVAIDLPSGLSADTPDLIGPAIQATLTVTLGAPKLPLVLPPGEESCGPLVVAQIGIPQAVIDDVDGPRIEVLTRETLRDAVPPRSASAHKGDFGRVVIVAGSRGKTGAAHLAGLAAVRSGAGLVTVATPASALPIVAAMAPEYMTAALPESPDGEVAAAALQRILELPADVIAVGPGLGSGAGARDLVHALLERTGAPLVLDADALNAFRGHADALRGRDGLDLVITPHPGEMARLLGTTTESVQQDRVGTAREFATSHNLRVVLKGHRTLIASPSGTVAINTTGNPGMATGGTGDVLTGMVAAWLAQLLDADGAVSLAVYLHGLAGDLAEAELGQQALSARDLIRHLGDAVLDLTGQHDAKAPSVRSRGD